MSELSQMLAAAEPEVDADTRAIREDAEQVAWAVSAEVLAEALGAPEGTPWPELLERVRGLAGTAPEAIARARWASWRDQRGRSVTDPDWRS